MSDSGRNLLKCSADCTLRKSRIPNGDKVAIRIASDTADQITWRNDTAGRLGSAHDSEVQQGSTGSASSIAENADSRRSSDVGCCYIEADKFASAVQPHADGP